mmetsp:Transcript_115166/g.365961  ORF Transcript_115166/g.365961 Transcript_115166/m.365961 type:complete len:227 (-) Transcript_115166:674-1354(-)
MCRGKEVGALCRRDILGHLVVRFVHEYVGKGNVSQQMRGWVDCDESSSIQPDLVVVTGANETEIWKELGMLVQQDQRRNQHEDFALGSIGNLPHHQGLPCATGHLDLAGSIHACLQAIFLALPHHFVDVLHLGEVLRVTADKMCAIGRNRVHDILNVGIVQHCVPDVVLRQQTLDLFAELTPLHRHDGPPRSWEYLRRAVDELQNAFFVQDVVARNLHGVLGVQTH